ncbi:(Na+)-NQR maturation NqrM [Marinobacter adhaerens]|uniref:(Na+)-NQR maturation NqrM n=1 Tax=Marinobacter adhaerens TaxID=1033846 RepID=A0A851HSD4_9GAMM|nr:MULTISPECIES: (Na+)-NQR maturation NqrM [Marinobacter]NWN91640.1 (Na+)-NQR maturation NqrM [Marinobacter adhaerens]
MGTFLLVFMIVVLLVTAMSVGVIFGRKPISGTCGGIGALGLSASCDICGGNTQKCEEENQRVASEAAAPESLAYDAASTERTR